MPPDDSWRAWSKHVLLELKRLNGCYEELSKKMDKLNNRITLAQIKIAALGATVSLIVTVIVLLIANFMKKQ